VGQATQAAIELCQELELLGIQTMADGHDITTHAEQIIENIIQKWGRIDVVINNAG
jgi:NADP-dependent 3-hydroxy acid dehydrogenase YdfG